MNHTQNRIQLDWTKLHGFKLVEHSRDGANGKLSQAVLGAKLGAKACTVNGKAINRSAPSPSN